MMGFSHSCPNFRLKERFNYIVHIKKVKLIKVNRSNALLPPEKQSFDIYKIKPRHSCIYRF